MTYPFIRREYRAAVPSILHRKYNLAKANDDSLFPPNCVRVEYFETMDASFVFPENLDLGKCSTGGSSPR